MKWRNRIVEHRNVAPRELRPHPRNHRLHPLEQQAAMDAALEEIGFIHGVIVSRYTMTVLNGHLRVMLALRDSEPTIPVTFVDVTRDEEDLILATFDRLAAMAETDAAKLKTLFTESLGEVDMGALAQTMNDYAQAYNIHLGELLPESNELEERAPHQADPSLAIIRLGPYKTEVPIGIFTAWQNKLLAAVGTADGAFEAEVRRRLGL